MRLSKIRRFCTYLITMLLLCPFAHGALAESDAIAAADFAAPPMLRVLLTRFGDFERLDMTLNGSYSAELGDTTVMFGRGTEITVIMKNEKLYLYYMDISVDADSELTLMRHPVDPGTLNGIEFANNPAVYEGDLDISVVDGKLRLRLTIGVEDYVKGVVPYEMSDTYPLEALKAQAIAVRTYAISKALANAKNEYDLVDNTNDQVYRGRRSAYAQTEKAVDETRGICGFYKNSLVICYYSASNGGQTELAEHVWRTSADTGYLAIQDDPYDLENPQSRVQSIVLPKTADEVRQTPYVFRMLLCEYLADSLTGAGYDPSPENLRVDKISAVWVDTPRYSEPSKLYTMLHVTLDYSGRTCSLCTPEPDESPTASPAPTAEPTDTPVKRWEADDEEVSLYTPDPGVTLTPSPAPTTAPEATTDATPAPTYGPFEQVAENVTVDIPLFPDAIRTLSLGINSDDNEMVSVSEQTGSFIIESRRYGHGVGLSQRGAEWMAGTYAMTFQEILSFYYPGMTLMRFSEVELALPKVEPPLLETAGPVPTPTPRPTLMPVSDVLPEGAWYATVTEIAEDSTLNLRASPDYSGQVLMKLYKNQRLIVLEQCPQEDWVHVKTEAIEGYVMKKFLTEER